MKPSTRIQLAAKVSNTPDGLLNLHVEDYTGGVYGLQPLTDKDGIVLPHATAGRYELSISGSNPAALKRLANALSTLARKQEEGDNETETPAEDDV